LQQRFTKGCETLLSEDLQHGQIIEGVQVVKIRFAP
jgi:predicted nucleic acid-binding protein